MIGNRNHLSTTSPVLTHHSPTQSFCVTPKPSKTHHLKQTPSTSNCSAGVDCTWQTNFLGPFLLTELLGRFRQKHQSLPVRCEDGMEGFFFLALNGWGKNWKDDNGKQPKLFKKTHWVQGRCSEIAFSVCESVFFFFFAQSLLVFLLLFYD